MNSQTKTAIQAAEQDLEKDKADALKKQIYDYLKGEVDSIETIESQMRKLNEQKKAHQENIKNLKQGNLKAIEERTKSFSCSGSTQASLIGSTLGYSLGNNTYTITSSGTGGNTTVSQYPYQGTATIYNVAASQQAIGNISGYAFYANYVAGQSVTTANGKVYIF